MTVNHRPKRMFMAIEREMDMRLGWHGRLWLMGEVETAGDDPAGFHGIQMNWAGDMTESKRTAKFGIASVP